MSRAKKAKSNPAKSVASTLDAFEASLARTVTSSSDDGEVLFDFPMIMALEGHYNRNLILDYEVPVERADEVIIDIDERVDLPEPMIQRHLKNIMEKKDEIKRNLWDEILPTLIGFTQAQEEVSAELSTIFGVQPVNLQAYTRLLGKVSDAAGIRQIAKLLNVTEDDAGEILRSILNDSINHRRLNAGSGNGQQQHKQAE